MEWWMVGSNESGSGKSSPRFFGAVTSPQANQQPHVLQHCTTLVECGIIEGNITLECMFIIIYLFNLLV